MAEKFVEKKTKQAESKVESVLVDVLEAECSELGKQLEQEKAKVIDKSIDLAHAKKIIDQQNVVSPSVDRHALLKLSISIHQQLQEQMTEIMSLRNSKRVLEE